ncbi:MAG: hypothetical protein IJ688_08660 [Treponema sp.]|nr:hypothetical protein [Treponema sp.]
MKKIVMGIAALAMAASVFAVDFAARTVMEGSIAGGTIDIDGDKEKEGTLTFWNLSAKDQKDADALVVSVNNDNAGAKFQMWYKYDGTDPMNLGVRGANIWFKPIDMLKVTVGDVSLKTFGETLDYWKSPDGGDAATHQTWSWSGYSSIEGAGIALELTPVDGLWIAGGLVAKTGSDFAAIKFNSKDDETYASWGIDVKYGLAGVAGIPMNIAASYRDAGKDGVKIAAIGAEYGNRYGSGLYALFNARFRFENFSYSAVDSKVGAYGTSYTWKKKNALQAVAFDTMFRYKVEALEILGRFPVTLRTVQDVTANGKKASDYDFKNPSWMSYELKVIYALDGLNVYLDVENDTAVTFDKNFAETCLDMNVQPGITCNFGGAALDLGLKLDIPNKKGANLGWSVPFNVAIAF